jgi:glycosyltransferase involved in cell wall biosynthesis
VGLTVLVNAGPWLPVPPHGYGGIENVVATLVPELRRLGHRVILATVGDSTVAADAYVRTFPEGQFPHITGPYNAMSGIAHAHMRHVVTALRADRSIDLVHDHLEVVGPAVLAAMGDAAPPVLQTLHWDLRKHPDFYAGFDGGGRVFFAGVSESQVNRAPANLRRQTVGFVPLATPLPPFDPAAPRGDFLLTMGRVTPIKGYDVAARLCAKRGDPLVLAGPVSGFADERALDAALEAGDPAATYPDVRHFVDDVRPWLDAGVRWVGSVAGAEKQRLLGSARAVLFPLRWEEPGATAVIEALSAGTPVVAMRRGVLPSLVEHGRTGWLADTEEEFADALDRLDEIDPAECRRVAEERFGPAVMAERYEALYERVLRMAETPRR